MRATRIDGQSATFRCSFGRRDAHDFQLAPFAAALRPRPGFSFSFAPVRRTVPRRLFLTSWHRSACAVPTRLVHLVASGAVLKLPHTSNCSSVNDAHARASTDRVKQVCIQMVLFQRPEHWDEARDDVDTVVILRENNIGVALRTFP